MTEWTKADSDAAIAEGWDIFDCDGSDNGPFQLCKFDDPDDPHWASAPKPYPFSSDEMVWVHVFNRAEHDGSPLHNRALDFLREHNPDEYDAIHEWVNS